MRPMCRPARRTSSRRSWVMSTNWVGPEVLKRSRLAIIARSRKRRAEDLAPAERRRLRLPRPTSPRWRGQRRSADPGGRCPRVGARPAPGKGHPSAGPRPGPRVRPGPAAGSRTRSGPRPAPVSAGRRGRTSRPHPGRTCTCPRARRSTGRPAAQAPGRSPGPGPSCDGLDEAGGQLPEGRKRSQAGLVVPSHHVIEAEAEDRIQDEGNQDFAGDREPYAPILLEAVELLLDDLAVPREELGQVRPEALGSGCLYQEVEGSELDVAKAPERG